MRKRPLLLLFPLPRFFQPGDGMEAPETQLYLPHCSFATESGEVPCQTGERVTIVSSPVKCVKRGSALGARPPGRGEGEPMQARQRGCRLDDGLRVHGRAWVFPPGETPTSAAHGRCWSGQC